MRVSVSVLLGALGLLVLVSPAPADAKRRHRPVVSLPEVMSSASEIGIGRVEAPPMRSSASYASQVIALVNVERAKVPVPALTPSPRLNRAAQRYAEVLAPGPCFAHTCGPVPNLSSRINAVGYTGWRAIGENIAAGQTSPQQVMADWMGSTGHRDNILNPAYQNIGVAVVSGSGQYGVYWVQDFGGR